MAHTINDALANANSPSGANPFATIADVGGGGTVTSVAMTVPSILSVAGSPVTTSGTLAVTLTTEPANRVFAGPTTGADATPTFRALVTDDLSSGMVTLAKMSGTHTQHGVATYGAADLAVVVPGTVGNVLTSDGTDWVSSPPAASGLTHPQVMTRVSFGGF